MSINTKREIKCPGCSTVSDMTLWQSITADDSPDLKEDLLKGKINIFRCPACSQVALVPEPMLYTDAKRKLMMSFSPCERESRNGLFEKIKETSRTSGELDNLDGYNLRFVTEYNELLEKILIFDNDLNDKVIEVIKLLVLMQEEDKMDNRVCIFGKCADGFIEFMVQDKKEEQIYTSRVPMLTYETVSKSLTESGVKFKSFNWEMVDAEYASKLLRGTNNTLGE